MVQPAAGIHHNVLNLTAQVIEDHIINLAQLLVINAIDFGTANVVFHRVGIGKTVVTKRAVMRHSTSWIYATVLGCGDGRWSLVADCSQSGVAVRPYLETYCHRLQAPRMR